MDKPWGHYAKWNKPVIRRQILWFHLDEILKNSQNHRDRKKDGGLSVAGRGGEWEYLFNSQFQFYKIRIMEMDGCDVYNNMNAFNTILLKWGKKKKDLTNHQPTTITIKLFESYYLFSIVLYSLHGYVSFPLQSFLSLLQSSTS